MKRRLPNWSADTVRWCGAFAAATFVVLAAHAGTLARRRGQGNSVTGWLYRVAVNSALNLKRQAHARRKHETAFAQVRQAAGTNAETAELLSVLDEELSALPARLQAPLVLCHLEGKTQQQAAHELGLTYATVRRRLDGAKRQLHNRLTRRGFALTAGAAAMLWNQTAAASPPTPSFLAMTLKAAAAAGKAAEAPLSWFATLVASLTACGAAFPAGCSKVAAACMVVKLKAAVVLVVLAAGVLTAAHFAGEWTAQADEAPATVATAKIAAPRRAAASGVKTRRRTSPTTDSAGSEPPASAASRSARANQHSESASPSTTSEAFQAELDDNGRVNRFDDPTEKQTAIKLVREKMRDFPGLPKNPLIADQLGPNEAPPPPQAEPAVRDDAADAGADLKPKRGKKAPDDRTAKRNRAGEERRNKTQRAAKPSRKKSTAKVGSKVDELYGIAWHSSVERALAAARGVVTDERDKPVLCLRVLGDLAGFM